MKQTAAGSREEREWEVSQGLGRGEKGRCRVTENRGA